LLSLLDAGLRGEGGAAVIDSDTLYGGAEGYDYLISQDRRRAGLLKFKNPVNPTFQSTNRKNAKQKLRSRPRLHKKTSNSPTSSNTGMMQKAKTFRLVSKVSQKLPQLTHRCTPSGTMARFTSGIGKASGHLTSHIQSVKNWQKVRTQEQFLLH
jgi:hypothetical protein